MSETSRKKLYYTISEVCRLTSLEPHVLRYWESEITQLRPKRNRSGDRAYKDRDIELINHIKRLLYDEKLTIIGAKLRITEERRAERLGKRKDEGADACEDFEAEAPAPMPSSNLSNDLIAEIREGLEGILRLLEA